MPFTPEEGGNLQEEPAWQHGGRQQSTIILLILSKKKAEFLKIYHKLADWTHFVLKIK